MQRGNRYLLLAALLLAAHVQLRAQDPAIARVLALETAWNDAQSHKDAKALAGLLAPTFVYTDADGGFSDKTQFLADIRTGTSSQIMNEGMKAESYGDVIVVTGIYREQGTENGKLYHLRGRFTDTWILRESQWLCVASQETLIPH